MNNECNTKENEILNNQVNTEANDKQSFNKHKETKDSFILNSPIPVHKTASFILGKT